MFPDEKSFWERCGQLLIESEKFEAAISIYSYLFKNDPFSSSYLKLYVECLKKSFKFDELDDLKENLKSSHWIDEETEKLFDWRADFGTFCSQISRSSESKELETLSIPFREINWTNYASILHAMATGNYAKIYKKQPFNPDNFLILNGPCVIEILGNINSTLSQNLLANTIHEYSASSMDDLSKKRSQRRKEVRSTQSIPSKTEQTAADLVKHLKSLFNSNEQGIIDTICSTELSCLQLLDKNNIVKSNDSMDTGNNSFTSESLNQRISEDNEVKKPLAQRICELVVYFLVQSRSPHPEFPKSLAKPILELWSLLKNSTMPLDALKQSLGTETFCELLLSVSEAHFSAKSDIKDIAYEMALFKNYSKSSNSRFTLLETLLIPDETVKLSKLEEFAKSSTLPLCTRYSEVLPALVTKESILSAIEAMKLAKTIEAAENLCQSGQFATVQELFASNLLEMISNSTGEMKLRLCKLAFKCSPPSCSENLFSESVSELIKVHSDLEIGSFIDYVAIFFKNTAKIATNDVMTMICIYWNIYLRKNLINNSLLPSLNDSFAIFLNNLLQNSDSAVPLDVCKFFLCWMAQEKCLGASNGLVPLKIFSLFASSTDFTEMKFAYSVIFSLLRFPNIFAVMDAENGLEEWDRSPIGIGSRDSPCPNLSQSEFVALSALIQRIDEMIDQADTKIVVSEPGFVSFVDWLKNRYAEIAEQNAGKHFFYCVELNRNHIKAFMNSPLEQHAQKQVLKPSRGHFTLEDVQSFRYLLNTRSYIVYSELQGRKKSFEILKTIRSDLKMSLAFNVSDAEVWKLLGTCYHDAAIHFMSSEAEFMIQNSAKLKRCMKKAILALKYGLTLEPADQGSWMKLCDLIDWSLHEPSKLSIEPEIVNFLCSVGCSCVQALLPGVVSRDRWILFLRLELFLRKSGTIADDTDKQLELLKEASLSACRAYSENVYESTALYMSLVKFYSRLSKLRISGAFTAENVQRWLDQIQGSLPTCLRTNETRANGDLTLLDSLESLSVLDRKKIFHSQVTSLAWFSFKILGDTQSALNQLQQLFPFLKGIASSSNSQKKNSSSSLLQIYQNDHERPARFLICGRRYLLQLVDFIAAKLENPQEILTQFLKKLFYIRRTILGFPEILAKATLAYLKFPEPDESIVQELIESLKDAYKGKIRIDIKQELIKRSETQNNN